MLLALAFFALTASPPLRPPPPDTTAHVTCTLSLGQERHTVRTYPAVFDDFTYASADWGRGIFGLNRWALCDETRARRAWYRFSTGARRHHWNPRGEIVPTSAEHGSVSLVMPRGYTGNAAWVDSSSFNPALQLNVPVGTGTYAARVHFSDLERGKPIDQAFYLYNHDTKAELDFEWSNAPIFCGGSAPRCDGGFLFVTNHAGPGVQEGAYPLFCRGEDPCRAELMRDFVVLLMHFAADGVRYEVHGEDASGNPVRWGPRVLADIVPEGPLFIWIGNGIQSPSTFTLGRDHRLRVDWVYHTPAEGLSVSEVLAEVARFRGLGLSRVNTL